MAYSEFDYRLSGARTRRPDPQSVASANSQERSPNRKSIAKKKWWAEKRERERKALSQKD